jgi:two-component system sensor kinase FixL
MPESAQRLVRRFGFRYLAVLAAVAALVLVDQAVVQPMLTRLGEYAPVINLAGRQRMLSQKLSKAALAQQAATDEATWTRRRDELRETLAQWQSAHAALRAGDASAGISRRTSPTIEGAWKELDPHFLAMCAIAGELAAEDFDSSRQSSGGRVADLLNHETSFLATMDSIVKLLEREAEREVGWLRRVDFAIGCAVIVLLIGLGAGVVLPATRTIRRQVESLEARVAERTRELDTANQSLRHEIVEREAAEANQQRLAAQLAHAGRVTATGHLTAGIAHELNQPLCAIANFAAASEVLLAREDVPHEELRQNVGHIQQAALRAGQIVRRMREFLRPQRAAPAVVDLGELIREVAEFCRPEIESAEAHCRLELADRPLKVRGDRIQIQQVLVNLLQNAVDAMRANEPEARAILVCAQIANEHARVEVHDNGPGFAPTVAKSLFSPFQTTKPGGLGIGLSIAQSILEQHGGRISAAASALYSGANVTFTIPLATTHEPARTDSAVDLCRG